MCGIAGIVSLKSGKTFATNIRKMSASMSHRGPDATGYYETGSIALGHNRLSIIDLSSCSNQPMTDHSGRYTIVFNGEIYNYKKLKGRLSGYPFSTNGDTEVILAAYINWGPECVAELDGMFALAIWDEQQEQLYLARDRMGVKPLYYHDSAETFVFGSEIKAILASGIVHKKADPFAISEFLQYQSVSFPNTIIEGITMLDAGTWMTINKSEKTISRYWNLLERQTDFDYSNSQLVKENIRRLFSLAVEKRMVSDVPVAAFLSGGIDSSAIVAMMAAVYTAPVNTFNLAFEEAEFDESHYARLISRKFNTHHQQLTLKSIAFLDSLLPALDALDSPSGDGINNFVVSQAINSRGIKVALSGIGGDELFAGYPIFNQYRKLMRLASFWSIPLPLRTMFGTALRSDSSKKQRLKQLLRAKQADIASFYPVFRQIITPEFLQRCTTLPIHLQYPGNGTLLGELQQIQQLPVYSQLSAAEYLGYTQHTLLRDTDQMSMANSLEIREPFFDHQLVSFVLNVPDKQKRPIYPKKLLVDSLGELLPHEIVFRKKQGFVLPWKQWMKTDLKSFCELHIEQVSQREFFKGDLLKQTWKRFLSGDPNVRWMEIWLFVVLNYWLTKNDIN